MTPQLTSGLNGMAAGNASGFALTNAHEAELVWVIEGTPSADVSVTVTAEFERGGIITVEIPLSPKAAL